MNSLDDMKKIWNTTTAASDAVDQVELDKVIDLRLRKERKIIFGYFWSAFFCQIFLYAIWTHLAIRNWKDSEIVLPSVAGIMIYIPFTIVMMKKFKAIAKSRAAHIQNDIISQTRLYHQQLSEFFRFKKIFDWLAIPLMACITVFIFFKLYVPGGYAKHFTSITIVTVLSLVFCVWAIILENKTKFILPLRRLEAILKEADRTFPEVV